MRLLALIYIYFHSSTFRDMKLTADYQKKKESIDIEIIIDTTGELAEIFIFKNIHFIEVVFTCSLVESND